MNARRKKLLRQQQYWVATSEKKRLAAGKPPTLICNRCQKPFRTEWISCLARWSVCCQACQCRNFYDALEIPTPPDLLDRHTRIPTLSKAEFERKLKEL